MMPKKYFELLDSLASDFSVALGVPCRVYTESGMCSIGEIGEGGTYRAITQSYNAKTLHKVALDMLEGIRLGKALGKNNVNNLHLGIAIEVARQFPEEIHGANMPISEYREIIIHKTKTVIESGLITEDSEDIDEIIEKIEAIQVKTYTVFVGGVEVNDYLLTKSSAHILANQYRDDGYDDVQIVCVNSDGLLYKQKIEIALNCMIQDDAVGEVLVFTRKNARLCMESIDPGNLLFEDADKYELIIIDGGNSHGDRWKYIFHPPTKQQYFISE